VARLPDERERSLIERHYFDDEQLSTIAEELGVSRPWASRLHARAIRNLATDFRARSHDKKSKAPAAEG
jgi:RNA polymerase sigma factor for flagellar operon FliA